MYIKDPSNVLECDTSCRTYQGREENHLISLTLLSDYSCIQELGQNKAIQPQSYISANVLNGLLKKKGTKKQYFTYTGTINN
jgi:hypothetical protein